MPGTFKSLQDPRSPKRSFLCMLGVSSRCAACLKLRVKITETKMDHPTELDRWPTEYQPVVHGICRPCSKYKRVRIRRPVKIEHSGRLSRMVLCRDTPGRDTTRTSELYWRHYILSSIGSPGCGSPTTFSAPASSPSHSRFSRRFCVACSPPSTSRRSRIYHHNSFTRTRRF